MPPGKPSSAHKSRDEAMTKYKPHAIIGKAAGKFAKKDPDKIKKPEHCFNAMQRRADIYPSQGQWPITKEREQ